MILRLIDIRGSLFVTYPLFGVVCRKKVYLNQAADALVEVHIQMGCLVPI